MQDVLQEVQMEVQAQQQEVLDKKELQAERKKQLHEKFLELQLEQQHLQSIMREVSERTKNANNDAQIASSDDPSTKLIALGIYSDPHLLAVMYSGEMAYW